MKRKIFVGVFCAIVLLLAFVWQLTASGGILGSQLGEKNKGSHTLWSYMAPAVIVAIDGTLGPGWDAHAYKTTITMREIGGAGTMDATIWIMNDAQYLYIALSYPDSTASRNDGIRIYLDEENDGNLRDPYSTSGDSCDAEYRDAWSEDYKRVTWGTAILPGVLRTMRSDYYWGGSDWMLDGTDYFVIVGSIPPTGTLDFDAAMKNDGSSWNYELRIPLNSQDRYDLNVNSGDVLGIYIMAYWAQTDVLWAYGDPDGGQTGNDESENPWNWDTLMTKKVFSASISHAHDGGGWVAYVGVQNTGTKPSKVVFKFSDGYVTDRTVAAGAEIGDFVSNFHGGTPFVGAIHVYSDQPFTALMNQRNAGSTVMGQTTYVGEN